VYEEEGRPKSPKLINLSTDSDQVQWVHHQDFGARAGLSTEEIVRTRMGADAPGWRANEEALLRAVDELHDTSRISDGVWSVLRDHYSDEQLIEIPMVVGHYHLVAYVVHGLSIEIEEVV
jgi:4-carboxymuconolactone decarboxylase